MSRRSEEDPPPASEEGHSPVTEQRERDVDSPQDASSTSDLGYRDTDEEDAYREHGEQA
jgi:hypothetical protein